MLANYKEIAYWKQSYGRAGLPDKKAVAVFLDCESDERVNSFKAQLHSISKGGHDEKHLLPLLGADRKVRHGTFERWAQLMLIWVAEVKNRA